MSVPRYLNRIRWSRHLVHKVVSSLILATLLAGLIPPPAFSRVLPAPVAELADALLLEPSVAQAAGTISGTVFQDFNSNGAKDSATVADPRTDGGVAGVTVTVYDSAGAAQGTDLTDATGAYSIAATGTGPYRVEFTTLPTGYYPTTHNSNSGSNTTAPNSTTTTAGTTVQFVPDGNSSNVNLGINRPAAYAQSDVRLAMPMQLAGDQSETSAVLYDWPYTNSGTTPAARTAAQASQIGTTWGLAYQKTTKTLFASTAVRRHAGLGSLGLGGIYQIDYASGSPVASTFVDLDAAPFSVNFGTLGDNSARGLPASPTLPSQDATAFAAVAKQGIGDIDLSEDGNTLWVVNLNSVTSNVAGNLLKLDVTGGTAPTSATTYAISSFSGLPTCTNGVLRPWALKFANGKGYLGVVCSAELAGGVRDNLAGYVLSFNPNAPTAFTTELTIPLGSTYGKGIALQLTSAADLPNIAPNTEQWYPWTDTYTDVSFNRSPNGLIVARPTPVLSDIEFDESGHLIVGFLDRAAMQLGSVNYPPTSTAYTIQVIGSGDVVRACVNGAGIYTLESNGACGGLNGAGVGNGDGPGGGEYYHDLFTLFTLQHQEILNGGLAVLAGTSEIAATAFDPVATLDTTGVLFLANSTGAKNDGYQVGPTNQKNSTNGYFAKSFGLGDIELLADPAPIEIGNRVWNDADGDGLQDPNEAPISGVTVELYKNSVKVGQATTDAQGEYYFTSGTSATDSNANDNIIHDSGIGILPGTGTSGADSLYEIRIPNVSGGSKQAALGTNSLTTANAGSNDSIDSDGAIPSGQSYAGYAIPYADLTLAGYNNHTYDFGFGPATGTIQIVKNTVGANGAFAFTSTDSQLDAVSITTVGNTGNSGTAFTKNAGAYTISEDALPANWALTNLTCSGDSDSGSTITLASRQVVIDLDAGEAIVCTFTNTYTAPVADPGSFSISKAIATTDGSNPTVSGTFDVVVSCPGVSGYPATLSLNADGTPIAAGNLAAGTVCSFSEDTLTLPAAPSGYTWVNAQIEPASIAIQSNVTATVTATNWLAPLPTQPTNVLTVTKTISGTGNGPFAITINGPSGYITNTQIDDGDVLTFAVPTQGVYTVTESTPAGWTTVYTATPGTVSSVNGVVTVANQNTVTLAATPITGKVYNDYNSDGQITANGTVTDTGVSGVTVTVYDKAGNSVGSATTASDGTYTINPTGDGPYRVEFTNLPSSYGPTTHGTGNGTSTQFVTTAGEATNVNLGILDPCDYCEGLPRIVAQTYVNRDISTAFTRTLVSMPYTVGGVSTNGQGGAMPNGFAPYYDPSKVTTVVDAVEIGATFGLAYQRNSRTLFAAAFMKASNGTPATANGFGPGGPGAIYQIAPGVDGVAGTADDVPSVWLDINSAPYAALLGANAAGTDPHVGGTSAQADAEYHAVGKIGFGGMAIGPDDETLYTINLNQRALYILPIGANQAAPAATLITTQDIPYPADCTSGTVGNPDVRPFALTIHRNRGYVGLLCTAESTQNKDALRAYVYPFDLSTGVFGNSVLNVPLTYTRASLVDPVAYRNRWFAWTVNNTQVVNQPWLTDLQFDGDDLILAFRNRLYDQRGDTPFTNGGDVLRACAVGGVLTLESNGRCGGVAGAGANGQFFVQGDANSPWSLPYGPGGGYYYLPRNSDGGNGELRNSVSNGNRSRLSPALGGLALLPGARDTIITQIDPSEFHNAGLMWVRNSVLAPPANRAGYGVRAFQVLPGNSGAVPGEALYGGKGSGMGDMVLLCDPAPIEIGNRVWDDLDGDGVQDPGEPGLNGVQVSLAAPTGTVGTANTSGDGNYYFGNLQANTHYTLTITSTPAGYRVTTPNAQVLSGASVSSNHAISDTRDSDAVLVGGVATIYYTTGSAGQNNHGLDFGFTKPASGQVDILNTAPVVSLGNRVWYDTNNNGTVDGGEQNVADGVVVELYQDSDGSGAFSSGDTLITRTLTSGGYYTFTNLAPSSSLATHYLVVISDTNFVAGGLLVGYVNSSGQYTDTVNAAGNNRDHGATVNRLGQAGGVVASKPISLTATTQPTGEGNEGNDPIQASADGNSNQTIDFGFYQLTLGNRIWADLNNNGQDDNEPDLNVTLTVTATNQTTAAVYTTTTDANGYYTFTGIVSGTYVVSFQAPAGYVSSSTDGTANGADLDDNGVGRSGGLISSAPFVLTPGATIAGVQTATNATGATANPSVDFGVWRPAALGNYVWLDTSEDGTQNEAALNGVNGVTVTLFYSNPTTGLWEQSVVTTTANHPITNDPGYYTFTKLISGTYYVSFTLPAGYLFTSQSGAVNDANNSDADATTGATLPVTLNAGEQNPNVDAGLIAETLSLGNRVWYDVNNNGTIDSGENGVPGVRVELYRDSNGSGDFTPGIDSFVAFSNTVSGGYYTFTALTEGGYVVVISDTNFTGTLLGYRSSDPTTADPNTNVDNDDNGLRLPNGVVASGVITLSIGAEPDGTPAVDGDNDANTNWTVDFGFYLTDLGDAPASYSTTLSNTTPYTGASHIISPTLYLGSRVDADEDGQPVTVGAAATNDDDTVSAAAVGGVGDDEDGIVFVNPLVAGQIVTVEVTVNGTSGYLNGWLDFDGDGVWTQAGDQIFDGVAVANGTTTLTFTVPLTASTNITTYARFRLSTDANLNFYDQAGPAPDGEVEDYNVLIQPFAGIGDRVWYDTNYNGIQDGSESGVMSVTVELLDSNGTVISMTATNATGYYSFTNLVPGLYGIRFVTSTLPAGYIITLRDQGSNNATDSDADPVTGRTVNTLLTSGEYDPDWDLGIWSPVPTIEVIKYTNGVDADLATGPIIAVGAVVTWTYEISNTGNVTLTNVTLGDDIEGSVVCPQTQLAPHTGMTCVLTGTATAGQYANTAIVTGTPTLGPVTTVTDTNPSHYYGGNPGLVLRKYTNGYDADDVTGPYIAAGDMVTWTYVITNTGNQALTNLALTDSVEGAITCPVTTLAAGASTICLWTGTAISGQYTNTAVVSGTTPGGSVLTFTNPSHYYGVAPSIDLIKYTNGEDADTVPGPTVNAGDPVTWTYVVTNTGNVALTSLNLNDDVEGAITCPATNLAVGASMTCTLTGTAGSGQYTNTAIVTGTPNIPTNPAPDLPSYPTLPTPNTPVTDTNPSHYFGQAFVLIGNRLWIEDDNDGDATTGTVTPVGAGHVVTATASDGTTIYTGTTDANGIYTITVPANDTYTVTTSLPGGGMVDSPVLVSNGSNPITNNDRNHDRSGTPVVVTTVDNLSIDFGFFLAAQFGDRVWIESDSDGNANTGTITPVEGMVITATNGTDVYTATTNAAGYYSFTVAAGTYTVTYGAVPSSYGTVVASATPGGNSESGNAGAYQQTGNPDQSHAQDSTVTVAAGQANWTVDFAFTPPLVLIGNRLWIEDDNDGDATTGTVTPVGAGQVVTATASDGTTVYTGTTDANGIYTITVPANDTYTVTTGLPAGGVVDSPVLVSNGSDPVTNNDRNHDRSGTPVVVTTVDNLSIDFGFFLAAQFGDRVWIESDSDGNANTGTITPVEGMVITATNGTDVYTATTNAAGYYSFTVAAGTYTVTYGAVPSSYGTVVASSTPGGNSESGNAGSYAQTGNPDQSHAQDSTVTVAAGQANWTVDFAFNPLAQFGDRVWIESDNDGNANTGTITPVEGMVITATNGTDVYTATTNAAGYYSFTVAAGTYTVTYGAVPSSYGTVVASSTPGGNSESGNAGAYQQSGNPDQSHAQDSTVNVAAGQANWTVDFAFNPLAQFGDRVWIESDNDGNANTGTITPVEGMVITATNGTAVYTATTNAAGYYSFTVAAGTYTVTYGSVPSSYGTVVASSTPGGNSESGNAGAYQQTGNPDQSHAQDSMVTVAAGQANWTVDFAFNPPLVLIGNRLWIEDDNDGDATTGTVTPVGAGHVVTATASDGTTVYTGTTDANGLYTITVPANATYTVTTDLPTGSVVDTSVRATDGSNPVTNNDLNHDRTGTTVVVTTVDNLSIDFGFFLAAQFGDRVWIESDRDGNANTGTIIPVEGMVITATNGTDVYTATTNAAGYYSFTVAAGTYTVTYGSVPSSYGTVVASSTPGGNSESGNAGAYQQTGNPDQSHAQDSMVTVAAGQANWTVDFAFTPPLVLIGNRLWIEDDNDGDATTGTVTPVGAGHVVTATASDGTTVYTGTTDANGLYTITVPANDTYTVTTGLPGGGVVDSPVLVSNGSNPITNNDRNHDRSGTPVVVTTVDNLSIDSLSGV